MTFSNVMLRLIALAVEVQLARRRERSDSEAHNLEDMLFASREEVKAYRSYCEKLSAAQIYMAIMVMYAGRGDFGTSFDILQHYEQMSGTFESPAWAIRQMLEKTPLPEYFAKGILLLDQMQADIDNLC